MTIAEVISVDGFLLQQQQRMSEQLSLKGRQEAIVFLANGRDPIYFERSIAESLQNVSVRQGFTHTSQLVGFLIQQRAYMADPQKIHHDLAVLARPRVINALVTLIKDAPENVTLEDLKLGIAFSNNNSLLNTLKSAGENNNDTYRGYLQKRIIEANQYEHWLAYIDIFRKEMLPHMSLLQVEERMEQFQFGLLHTFHSRYIINGAHFTNESIVKAPNYLLPDFESRKTKLVRKWGYDKAAMAAQPKSA